MEVIDKRIENFNSSLKVSELIGKMLFHAYHIGDLKVIQAGSYSPAAKMTIDRTIELHEEKIKEFKDKIMEEIAK
jgi:hypothetical protein